MPHLTIAHAEQGDLKPEAELDARATFEPFNVRVKRITVIAEGPDDRWRTVWRIPLGRPPAV